MGIIFFPLFLLCIHAKGTAAEAGLNRPPIVVIVNNKPINIAHDEIHIPVPNDGVYIRVGHYAPENTATLPAERFKFTLYGFDTTWEWHRLADMGVVVRFYNNIGDVIEQHYFGRNGDSPGWKGSIYNSPLIHCSETFLVPHQANTVTVGISSAGPPQSIGTYLATGLTVRTQKDSTSAPVTLLPPLPPAIPGPDDQILPGWIHDGTHPSMARLATLNSGTQPIRAFCITDNDPAGHAEWRMVSGAPKVTPGTSITVEWDELYSVGSAQAPARTYPNIPSGKYKLLINRIDVNGQATSLPSLTLIVPVPYWRNPWFWLITCAITLTPIILLMRYIIKIRVRNQLKRLQHEHAIELERLRIARNLHDDLGARLTHISLVSDSAENEISSLPEARQGFHKLSAMTRELVAILYETVWSVDPENDHLASLVNYLGRMIVDLCEPSEIQCRIHADEISENRKVTSEIRHNISLAIKEAVHNALKYSHATEINAHIHFIAPILTIVIHDNGNGFDPQAARQGHGLTNMQKRMETVGGTLKIESAAGSGTTVTFGIFIH